MNIANINYNSCHCTHNIVLSYCIMVTRCCITVIKYISAGNSGEAELLKLCIVVMLELMFNRSLKHDWLFLIN